MGRGDLKRFADSQGIEIAGGHIGINTIDLVDSEVDRFAALAQEIGNGLVRGGQAGAAVDQKNNGIGFIDGEPSLARHNAVDTLFIAGQPPGIDDQVGAVAEPAGSVFTVTGEAGEIRHQGVAGASQTVE